MNIDTKAFTVDIKMDEGDLADGEFLSIMSAPTLDRDGEIIDTNAFAPLPEKITVDIDHDMSVRSIVASGRPYYDNDGLLKIRGQFASTALAQDVRTLVREGHVDRMSVTFRAARREIGEDGVTHIRGAELLNVAFVAVPSNREAAVLAAKSIDDLTSDGDLAQAVEAMRSEIAELRAAVAELAPETFPEAPEAAPVEDAAGDEPAVDERAADRQRLTARARAYLAHP
jgi:HK97 family phage prohead protease